MRPKPAFVRPDRGPISRWLITSTERSTKRTSQIALIERQNDEDRTYRISYGELLAPIVKSIQEQQREITSARQENADLRHAVQALQDQAAAFKAENDALRHSLEVLSEQVRRAYRRIGRKVISIDACSPLTAALNESAKY